jgi:large subunit ribosomal protein L18
MKKFHLKRQNIRKRRTMRNRKKLRGTNLRPRLCVIKSNSHIQAQLIDDESGLTLVSAATFSKEFRNTEYNRKNKNSAKKIGEKIAEIARSKNINEAVFDRGSFKYHGILAELADAARGAGLKI